MEGGRKVHESALALTAPLVPSPEDTGFLRLADLLGKWGGKLEGTELVTLSACRTALGPMEAGEGFVALTWGFLYAGADAVIASLWQVDDTATTLLMTRMYENILGAFRETRETPGHSFPPGQPLPKAQALHEAKRWLRNLDTATARKLAADHYVPPRTRGARFVPVEPASSDGTDRPYADPFYWGAFILIGDGS